MTSGPWPISERHWRALAASLERPEPVGPARSFAGHAAVLMALTDEPTPHLLLSRRAAHLASHPGEVAFPGGKWEPVDADLRATALRETLEETCLPPDRVELLGALPEGRTLRGVRVKPFVGRVPPGLPLTPDPSELDRLFFAPLSAFAPDQIVRWNRFEHTGRTYRVPVYHWDGYTVWGFTAAMIAQLVQRWPNAR